MDQTQTSNQSRVGLEGRGGTKFPGNMLSRTSLRYVFVGGMVAAGLTWYASSHGLLGSIGEKMNAASRGGSKPPTVPGKDRVDEAPSATSATKPAPQAHGGIAQGVSEGGVSSNFAPICVCYSLNIHVSVVLGRDMKPCIKKSKCVFDCQIVKFVSGEA